MTEIETLLLRTSELEQLDKEVRTNLINSLSGFKSANLIGTRNLENQLNLAIFSSVCHIGANPALMGFIHRPTSVERHTFENIVATEEFTINAISSSFIEQAHQTAARYKRSESEFEKVGLHPFFSRAFWSTICRRISLANWIKTTRNCAYFIQQYAINRWGSGIDSVSKTRFFGTRKYFTRHTQHCKHFWFGHVL